MSSRSTILAAIRKNKPTSTSLPEIPAFQLHESPIDLFKERSEGSKTKVVELDSSTTIKEKTVELFPDAPRIASTISSLTSTVDLAAVASPRDLDGVDVTIIEGEFAVAENGAVWVTESQMVHRVLPFITQHLILVVEKSKVFTNMHQAYQAINLSDIGFGVFIAGPSKTADIEQSLVIGAQGARSLTVLLV